jgi:hypothetical protein
MFGLFSWEMIRAFCVVLVVPMMRNSELVYGGSCSLIWSFALTILDEILRLYKGVCQYVSLDLEHNYTLTQSCREIGAFRVSFQSFFFPQHLNHKWCKWRIILHQFTFIFFIWIWTQLWFNSSCMQFHLVFSFWRNLILTKSNHFVHHFVVINSVQ